MDEIRDFLAILAELLLIITLPIVIAAAVQHIRVMSKQLEAQVDERIGKDRREALVEAVKLAVQVAEQSGVLNGLVGPEKKQAAIDYAQRWLDERGVRIDVGKLAELVENEVRQQIKNPSSVADTAQARQELIDKSIEAAVLAAEKSGLSGLIANVGSAKKAYALQMVTKYLEPYGIQVDPLLMSGLVEAQLLKLQQPELAAAASPGAAVPPSAASENYGVPVPG